MITRTRCGPTGFTILFRKGHRPTFCQRVAQVMPNDGALGERGYIVLNLFEEFGAGGPANTVWKRLGLGEVFDDKLRLIKYMRPIGGFGEFYEEEYLNPIIVRENADEPDKIGPFDIISQVTVTFKDVERR